MKTVTIQIDGYNASVSSDSTINRDDFKAILRILVDTYGNQPGIKRTPAERQAARAAVIASRRLPN